IGESLLIPGVIHDAVVVRRRSANQEVAEYGRTGRRPTNDATASKHFSECLLGFGTRVCVDQMKLAPALEPDAASVLEHRDERIGVGELPVGREQNVHVPGTGLLPHACPRRVLSVQGGAACVWHVDDQRVRSTRGLDELVGYLLPQRAAANDDHGSARGAYPRRGRRLRLADGRCENCRGDYAMNDEHIASHQKVSRNGAWRAPAMPVRTSILA